MHILPNVSRSKSNLTIKFGQLVEYNMRNIFVENHTQNVLEKLFPDPYLKYQNWKVRVLLYSYALIKRSSKDSS